MDFLLGAHRLCRLRPLSTIFAVARWRAALHANTVPQRPLDPHATLLLLIASSYAPPHPLRCALLNTAVALSCLWRCLVALACLLIAVTCRGSPPRPHAAATRTSGAVSRPRVAAMCPSGAVWGPRDDASCPRDDTLCPHRPTPRSHRLMRGPAVLRAASPHVHFNNIVGCGASAISPSRTPATPHRHIERVRRPYCMRRAPDRPHFLLYCAPAWRFRACALLFGACKHAPGSRAPPWPLPAAAPLRYRLIERTRCCFHTWRALIRVARTRPSLSAHSPAVCRLPHLFRLTPPSAHPAACSQCFTPPSATHNAICMPRRMLWMRRWALHRCLRARLHTTWRPRHRLLALRGHLMCPTTICTPHAADFGACPMAPSSRCRPPCAPPTVIALVLRRAGGASETARALVQVSGAPPATLARLHNASTLPIRACAPFLPHATVPLPPPPIDLPRLHTTQQDDFAPMRCRFALTSARPCGPRTAPTPLLPRLRHPRTPTPPRSPSPSLGLAPQIPPSSLTVAPLHRRTLPHHRCSPSQRRAASTHPAPPSRPLCDAVAHLRDTHHPLPPSRALAFALSLLLPAVPPSPRTSSALAH
ncbi:hypothetical protein DENSPDRAFT_886215 [Dentipellis sp. KUC8613]|nr:hypothetical protein DENSPDRAFT_886215 [Dentipellis sp. KUC8613]